MNRLSDYNKYILKDGKYVRMSKEDQKSCFDRGRRSVGGSSEQRQDQTERLPDDFLPQCHTSRQVLCTEMSSSAIYPRKIEFVQRQAMSRKVSDDSVEEQNPPEIPPQSIYGQLKMSLAPRLQKLSLGAMQIDTQSKNSEQNEDDSDCIEGSRKTDVNLVRSKLVMPTVDQLQQSSAKKGHIVMDKYKMSSEQQVIWLKRMLQDRQREVDKLFHDNSQLKREMNFLKERVVSFQRVNHGLETQNAKMRMQLFSEEQLIELCCRQQGQLNSLENHSLKGYFLEQQLERLKFEINRMEEQLQHSETRSEIVDVKKGNSANDKLLQLKRQLKEKRNIIEAHHLGLESKESLKKYITNIVEKAKADEKMIEQLKGEISNKEVLICEMDRFISDMSCQLTTCKQELAKYSQQPIMTNKTKSKSMHSSGITSATTILPQPNQEQLHRGLAQGLLNLRYTECQEEQDGNNSHMVQSEEEPKQIRRKLDWDIEEKPVATIRRLKKDLNDRQRLIGHYEEQLKKLMNNDIPNHNEQSFVKDRHHTVMPTQVQTDYMPSTHQLNSSIRMKQRKIGGQSSRIKILTVKRASLS